MKKYLLISAAIALIAMGSLVSAFKAKSSIGSLESQVKSLQANASTTEDSIKSISLVIINMYCRDYPRDINCSK